MKKISYFTAILFVFAACNTSSKNKVNPTDDAPTGALTFLTTRDGNFEIYKMTADGKNAENLTNNKAVDFWSSWSPDAEHIIFYSNRDGNNEIYRMNEDGTNLVNLSNHPSHEYLPTWSPDGKKIVYNAYVGPGSDTELGLWMMNADGTGATLLLNRALRQPDWTAR